MLTFHTFMTFNSQGFYGFFDEIFYLLFFPIRCENDPFLHFLSSYFVYNLSIFRSYGNILFQQFFTLNSRKILIFKFSQHSIPTNFCLKLAKQFLRLSQHFFPVTFSSFEVTYMVPLLVYISNFDNFILKIHVLSNLC